MPAGARSAHDTGTRTLSAVESIWNIDEAGAAIPPPLAIGEGALSMCSVAEVLTVSAVSAIIISVITVPT
jgi:hypothetical protein